MRIVKWIQNLDPISVPGDCLRSGRFEVLDPLLGFDFGFDPDYESPKIICGPSGRSPGVTMTRDRALPVWAQSQILCCLVSYGLGADFGQSTSVSWPLTFGRDCRDDRRV